MSIRKRIARLVVVMLANNQYRKAVKKADRLYQKDRQYWYVVPDMRSPRKLMVMNRKGYRGIREDLYRIMDRSRSGLTSVRYGAIYHTCDRGGANGLSAQEKETRRLAFVKMVLHQSGL